MDTPPDRFSRRSFLGGAGALAAGAALGPHLLRAETTQSSKVPDQAAQRAALAALGRSSLREPGSLPYPDRPAGTDTMPQIEHIVVCMLENHSYDNFLGMLPHGDGFTLGSNGRPVATNPYADGSIQHAFEMPTTCQQVGKPVQTWHASHVQYDGGTNQGFVESSSGPVAMGYFTGSQLPFTYSLASTFPVGDRWFCSLLGQTYPNRRYLIAGTSAGMVDDILEELVLPAPNGTIFDRLDLFGVSWTDYYTTFPTGATALLYPIEDAAGVHADLHGTPSPTDLVPAVGVLGSPNFKPIGDFFTDAAKGALPGFCIIDPNYGTESQEDPQNVVVGEAFLASVVHAVLTSPAWERTLLVYTYDEHGGYYDHVPPPPALAPDAIPPLAPEGQSSYDGFHRYGFRVPAVVVSPYSRPAAVTSVVHDHTSVLAMVERKWNLPALTYRDANANDLTDFLDMAAMKAGRPTFPDPPPLAKPGDTPAALACSTSGPGVIPPPGSVTSS